MPPANTPRAPSPELMDGMSVSDHSHMYSQVHLPPTLEEMDVEDENVRFLRSTWDELEDTSSSRSTTALDLAERNRRRHQRLNRQLDQLQSNTPSATAGAESQTARVSMGDYQWRTTSHDWRTPEQRERMQRVLSRISRFHETTRAAQPRPQAEAPQQRPLVAPVINRSPNGVSSLIAEVAGLREVLEVLHQDSTRLSQESPTTEGDATTGLDRQQGSATEAGPESDIITSLRQAERELEVLERRLAAAQLRMNVNERTADNLRSTAIMQHARTNASNTERMLRYIRDREQLGGSADNDDQSNEEHTRPPRGSGRSVEDAIDVTMNLALPQSTDLPPVVTLADNYLRTARDPNSPRIASRRSKTTHARVNEALVNALVHLENLRIYDAEAGGMATAIKLGLLQYVESADFALDLDWHDGPVHCSWLQPGVRYSGRQHTSAPAQIKPASSWTPLNGSPPQLARAAPLQLNSVAEVTDMRRSQPVDQWPVKLTIHSLDYDTMMMTGTMEAHDLPTTGGARSTPITTFLEGQIIDLHTHSFVTPKEGSIVFPATAPHTDAANWRRLPPFVEEPDDLEVAKMFMSRARLAQINSEYIFMRWKERCFIHGPGDSCPSSPAARRGPSGNPGLGEGDDTDKGHGLTICGFYYVSLERATGSIMGLYCDANTSPYQCLTLVPERSGLAGTWTWR